MLLICLDSHDPCFNLAVDEFLLKKRKEDFLVLYINDPSVIIGKHQVAHREADTKYVNLHKIPVIRRISGGGTVFHDRGNINFSFIMQSEHGKQVDFRRYTMPVIKFLSAIGIEAKFEGKNDLKVEGLKISGNAEHIYHDRVLHHGTLLFETQLEDMRQALRKDITKYSTRAVNSNPSHIMNLKEKLNSFSDARELILSMADYFLSDRTASGSGKLSAEEIADIRFISDTRYRKWEWNYAYGPDYKFNNYLKIAGKLHCCNLYVKDGIIWNCSISGSDRMIMVAKEMIGCRHMVEDLQELFRREKLLSAEVDVFDFF